MAIGLEWIDAPVAVRKQSVLELKDTRVKLSVLPNELGSALLEGVE